MLSLLTSTVIGSIHCVMRVDWNEPQASHLQATWKVAVSTRWGCNQSLLGTQEVRIRPEASFWRVSLPVSCTTRSSVVTCYTCKTDFSRRNVYHYLLQSTQMTVVVTIVRKPLSLPRSSQYFVTEEHTNLTHLTAVVEGSIWALSFDSCCFSQQPLVPPGAVVPSPEWGTEE